MKPKILIEPTLTSVSFFWDGTKVTNRNIASYLNFELPKAPTVQKAIDALMESPNATFIPENAAIIVAVDNSAAMVELYLEV